MTEMVSAMLRTETVDVDEDLFALGGHSLLAAQLVVRSEEVFGVMPPLVAVFDNPTVAGIAHVIGRLIDAEHER